jgi:hypothetical protein
MKMKFTLVLLLMLHSYYSYSQNSSTVDSVKKILVERYRALGEAMDKRDLQNILSFKTADFHSIGPDGKVLDNISMKEYTRQFITNNIPPYNSEFTILNLRLSDNKIVAVADVQQESTRKRELLGKIREVKTSVKQTET